MATTLQDFVAKLHADGVEAGRAEADRLLEDARRRAEAIRREAEEQAASVLAEAEAKANLLRLQAGTELRLAARDTLLQLRASLTTALESILRRAVRPVLLDGALLPELVRDVIVQYARADAVGERRIVVDVPEHLADGLADWLLQELGRSVEGRETLVDVRGILSEAGFEYRVDGSTIDMTLAAVVEALRSTVRPRLWEVLSSEAAEYDAVHARRVPGDAARGEAAPGRAGTPGTPGPVPGGVAAPDPVAPG
jgi:vacuolar-type H+-ATPase subunit E/Vma4